MDDTVISVENISKVYKLYPSNQHRLKEALHPLRRKYHTNFYALKNLNLTVKKGEILGVVGRNGAGKSTLLKIISGVTQPTTGQFNVVGNISPLLEIGSGFNPEFTGLENIFFYGSIMGFSRAEMEERVGNIISFADIGDFVSKPLKIYSTGMRARLAFAVAINIDPDILIIDEVLAVGDELFQRKCFAKIQEFMNKGVSIIFVTHGFETINQLCSRAVLIEKGELIIEGAPKLVTTQYHRFLYAKPLDAAMVLDEIARMNQDAELKKNIEGEISQMSSQERYEKVVKSNKLLKPKIKEHSKLQPYYLPELKPKSTVEYKNFDVEIFDVKITTTEGRRVNVLVLGDEYIYSYKVKFNIESKNVVFGIKIKDQKGFNITGMSTYNFRNFSADSLIKIIESGESYHVKSKFRCLLLNGIYFMNAGVSTLTGSGMKFLNRITDAICFKVLIPCDCLATGLIQMDQGITYEKV